MFFLLNKYVISKTVYIKVLGIDWGRDSQILDPKKKNVFFPMNSDSKGG